MKTNLFFVVKGSCIMNVDDVKTAYKEGELIFIPPFVHHSATVTSATPMFTLVQRQLQLLAMA
ncbi:MAG: cupin domain-containing protein [Ferruginibacter sp.]